MKDDRSAQVRGALLKGLGVIVAIAVAIALGTTLLVRALGLDGDQTSTPIGSDDAPVASPLPSSALPQPDDDESPSDQPTELVSPSSSEDAGGGQIELSISPVIARPMERINLTGTYRGADNVSIQVQRYEDGTWSNFDAKTTVRVGTFATYIMTGRAGENRFRVFDPQADQGSNVVLVTIQ